MIHVIDEFVNILFYHTSSLQPYDISQTWCRLYKATSQVAGLLFDEYIGYRSLSRNTDVIY
jgi:hypothetical protein